MDGGFVTEETCVLAQWSLLTVEVFLPLCDPGPLASFPWA